MAEQIKLTITMLVSNRIDTIRKCMDSINPLLQQIPSELIVVDTGSSDGSIDVVREYTDKIVPFAWCDDFAKARNAGLRDARGEWVMYMDDDEWFEDVTEIVEFFDTGEYRKYNRGIYLVRNYADAEGTVWVDSTAERMVRRFAETRFEGIVHEYITPQAEPVKNFSAYAHHYGYAFASEEENRKHFERNIKLLDKDLEHNSENIRTLAQAAQEYYGIAEYPQALELCNKALGLYRQGKDLKHISHAGYCYNLTLRIKIKESDKGAYDCGKQLLAEKAPTMVAYLGVIREMVKACLLAEQYAEGLAYLDKYLKLRRKMKDRDNRQEAYFDLNRYFQEPECQFAYLEGLELAILGRDWDAAEHYLLKKNWDAEQLQVYGRTFACVVKLWTVRDFRQEYADILDCILESEAFRNMFQEAMNQYIGSDPCGYHKLLRIFGNCRNDSAMSRKYRFLYYGSLEEASQNQEKLPGRNSMDISLDKMLQEVWKDSENPLLWDAEMWDIIDRNHLSVQQEIADTPYHQWFAQVRGWLEVCIQEITYGDKAVYGIRDAHGARTSNGIGISHMDKVYSMLCQGNSGDLHMQFLRFKYQEGTMRKKLQSQKVLEQMEQAEILSCLGDHAVHALEVYGQIYRTEIFSEEAATILPPDGAFAVYVRLALQKRQEDNLTAYMQFIGKAAKSYPVMKEVCKTLLKKEAAKTETVRNQEDYGEQFEFYRLAEKMKRNVKILLESGNTDTARQVISQLKQLIPEDEGLKELARQAGDGSVQ